MIEAKSFRSVSFPKHVLIRQMPKKKKKTLKNKKQKQKTNESKQNK